MGGHGLPLSGDRGRKEEPVLLSLGGRAVLGRGQGILVFTGCGLEQGLGFSGSLFPLQETLPLLILSTLVSPNYPRASHLLGDIHSSM